MKRLASVTMLCIVALIATVILPLCSSAQQGSSHPHWRDRQIVSMWSDPFFQFKAVAAFDSLDYVAAGQGIQYNGIYRTIDGGVTWRPLYVDSLPKVGRSFTYTGIVHPSKDVIVAVGDTGRWFQINANTDEEILGGVIIVSTDGGATWSQIEVGSPDSLANPHSINIIASADGRHIGVPVTLSSILVTDDGAKSWHTISSPRIGYATAATYPDSNTFAYVAYSTSDSAFKFYRTTNLGTSWDSSLLVSSNTYFNSVQCIGNNGWAAGGTYTSRWNPQLYKTTDAGKHWNIALDTATTDQAIFNSISFADSMNGLAVGQPDFIYRTRDGGETWSREESGLNAQLDFDVERSVAFPSLNSAVIGSADGSILQYNVNGLLSKPVVTYPHQQDSTPLSFDAEWNDVPGAEQYEVYSWNIGVNGHPYSIAPRVVTNTSVHAICPLPDYGYDIFVRATNATDTSNWTRVEYIPRTSLSSVHSEAQSGSFAAYPNPIWSGKFTLMGAGFLDDGPAEVTVYSVLGVPLLRSHVMITSGMLHAEIPTGHLAAGYYNLKLQTVHSVRTLSLQVIE